MKKINLKELVQGKSAVFIDAANILYSQQTLKWQVDYKKLAVYLQSIKPIFLGFYYGLIETNLKQAEFFAILKDHGYSIRTKPIKYIKTPKGTILKGNLDIELAFDVLKLANSFDTCILFSGDSDFEVILKDLRRRQKRVIVLSTKGHVSIELIRACDKYIDLKKLRKFLEREPKKFLPEGRKVYSPKTITKYSKLVNKSKK